jgi:two-component system, NarL family, sensor histidine kinase DegS
MNLQNQPAPAENPLADFQKEIESEWELTSRSLSEVNLMLDQSQVELNKLAQRNAVITTHLQQVQTQFDTMPRPDIRAAYNAALDAQQRMLVMRSQLDKLQNDRDGLQRYKNFLEKTRNIVIQGVPVNPSTKTRANDNGSSALEMVVKAQEDERQRLSRQMHDGPAQALSNFIVQAEIANRLLDIDVKRAKEELDNLKNAAMKTSKRYAPLFLSCAQ